MYIKTYFCWYTLLFSNLGSRRFGVLGCSCRNLILHICKYFGTFVNINMWLYILGVWCIFSTYSRVLRQILQIFSSFLTFRKISENFSENFKKTENFTSFPPLPRNSAAGWRPCVLTQGQFVIWHITQNTDQAWGWYRWTRVSWTIRILRTSELSF